MTAASLGLPTTTNKAAATLICRHAATVCEARELLEMLGLVAPDGHELLPDDTPEARLSQMLAAHALGGSTAEPPLRRRPEEPRPSNCSTPPGLRNLPQQATKPAPKPRLAKPRTLTAELEELERTDPAVAAAAASYDRMVERVTSRPLPTAEPTVAVETTRVQVIRPWAADELRSAVEQLTGVGFTPSDIARELGVSVRTVRTHVGGAR